MYRAEFPSNLVAFNFQLLLVTLKPVHLKSAVYNKSCYFHGPFMLVTHFNNSTFRATNWCVHKNQKFLLKFLKVMFLIVFFVFYRLYALNPNAWIQLKYYCTALYIMQLSRDGKKKCILLSNKASYSVQYSHCSHLTHPSAH